MKPAPFAYRRATDVASALACLTAGEAALIAGGQSLTPLLNLRMTTCDALVDIGGLPELRDTRDLGHAVFIGAGVTHAMIEDGLAPDPSHGLMRRAAAHIAYRAVRCHGTIGGSVALADPAADWPCILLALDATAVVTGTGGDRRIAVDDLLSSAYETNLRAGEIILGFEIPKLAAGSRTHAAKINRKAGAFANSLAVAVRAGAASRVTLGAASPRAQILPLTSSALAQGKSLDDILPLVSLDIGALTSGADAYGQHLHETNVKRVLAEVLSA